MCVDLLHRCVQQLKKSFNTMQAWSINFYTGQKYVEEHGTSGDWKPVNFLFQILLSFEMFDVPDSLTSDGT